MIPARRLHPATIAVFAVCVLATALAVVAAILVHRDTEQRLLEQRTDEAGAVLTTAVAGVQTPLAVAAELAEVTDGDPASFEATLAPLVGGQFAAAALIDAATGEVLAEVERTVLVEEGDPARVAEMAARAVAADGLSVSDTLDLSSRRIGYGFAAARDPARFVVYAESPLPDPPTGVESTGGPFDDLGYALYLGDEESDDGFLYSSETDLPIDGRRATTAVPFGDDVLLLVTTGGSLGGWLSAALPWIVGIGGLFFAAAAAVVTERLARGRRNAEVLAADVSRLYDEQQHRTETLQRSLLPRDVVAPDGMSVAARYWPATADLEIGGDFYDLFPLADDRWGVVIGDVCGKGIEAAALTGLTRHTVRAAAHHVTSPVEVLRWSHDAISEYDGDTYCTVCFGFLTVRPGRIVLDVSLGGHPHPLVCRADGRVEEAGRSGTVLGLIEPTLWPTTIALGPGDTVVLYTDGITDADADGAISVSQLCDVVSAHHADGPDAIAAAIDQAVHRVRPDGSTDDTALVVLRVE